MAELLSLVPGGRQASEAVDEKAAQQQIRRATAIIDSMTPQERRRPDILNGRRRKRIAGGSGTSVQEINQLVRQFNDAQRVMKQMTGRKGQSGLGALGQLFGT
jgi:signal recognition particle subunit SRP54